MKRSGLLALLFAAACAGRQIRPKLAITAAQAPGFDNAALNAVLNEANNGTANIHSIVIERQRNIVAEIYRSGADKTMMKRYGLGNPFAADTEFDATTLHDVRSVSKSVTSLLFGLTKYRDLMPGTATPVLNSYPEFAGLATPERSNITYGHLLTMTSGLAWKEWGRGFITSHETRLLWKNDRARYVLDREQDARPGEKFNYNGGSTAILADTLERKTGKPLAELARTELFEPLGISTWEWATDSQGRALPHAGLRLKPRDMIKIGRLVLQRGKWNGQQLIAPEWIEASLRTQVKTGVVFFSATGEELGYGYQWWTGHSKNRDRIVSWSAAIGNGGQRIYIVPELDMVVVFTAGDYGSQPIHRAIAQIFDGIVASVR